MPGLDETDLDILRLLLEDARRPYSNIAEAVDLSAPAVSDRIARLRDLGVIRRFTLDVDRSRLREGSSVLVELDLRPGAAEAVRGTLREVDGVEHLFVTAAGRIVFQAYVPGESVREWLAERVDIDDVAGYEVTLLDDAEWTPSLEGTEVTLACVECGNRVTSEGVSTSIDGTRYAFCCSSCEAQFAERYERISAESDA